MKKQNNTESKQEHVHNDLEGLVALKLYEFLCELSDTLVYSVGVESANDILINSLSVNLGHAIGQLSPDDQKRYSNQAKKVLKEHTLLGTMARARHVHGIIGQA